MNDKKYNAANSRFRKPWKIIPDLTPCCNGPNAIQKKDREIHSDADCISDGDYIVCPNHHDITIYVYGTGWWQANGGSVTAGPENATFDVWCHKCNAYWHMTYWSYRG